MWAYVKDGAIKQTNTVQTRLEINSGSYFPVKYANEWTKEQKEAYGVYEVVVDKTNYKDPEYYVNTDSTFTFSSGVVKETWGTATAKSVADVNFTAQDEKDGLGTEGELKKRGLAYNHKQSVSNQAYTLLLPSDWYAARKAEAGTAIPTTIANYRAAVRTKAADMHTKIDAADTVDKLAALYVYNTDNPPTRPLGEWPDPVE